MRRVLLLVVLLGASACGPHQPRRANLAAGVPIAVDTVRDCATLDRLLAPLPGGAPHMAPPLWRVRSCPERAGRALAAALAAHRRSEDTTALERATWLGHYLHDGALYAQAVAVAGDTGAAVWARVAAFRLLTWAKAPSQLRTSLRSMLAPPTCAVGCVSSYTGHYYHGMMRGDPGRWPAVGAPLPPGYAAAIDALCARVAADPAVPDEVRRAARHTADVPVDEELGGR